MGCVFYPQSYLEKQTCQSCWGLAVFHNIPGWLAEVSCVCTSSLCGHTLVHQRSQDIAFVDLMVYES